ncbi:MAG: ThuA domain-containing protein [Acidobacteria bacterium]|nr:ThuA domain-containing protein [Acidobacteriota bacterium]
MPRTTRRAALSTLAGAALLPGAPPKAAAFALIGDRYHNSDYIRTALARNLTAGTGLTIDFTDETKTLIAETLKGYKMRIIHRDGMIWPDGYPDESSNAAWVNTGKPKLISDPPVPEGKPKPAFWMKAAQGKAVRQFVENGGSAFMLHNVTHVGLTDPDFRHVLGAAYAGHPPIRTFKVKVTNPNHPITHGVKDFTVTDEQHYMDYDKEPKHLFLESVNEDGLRHKHEGKGRGVSAPAGWAFDYGKGRVCYLSPGHLLHVHNSPEYIKLQQNAVRWLLRQS